MDADQVGPQIPPHILAKRKRKAEEEAAAREAAKSAELTKSDEEAAKKRRTVGPASPPAPLEERPLEPPNDDVDENSSDDDIGPSLPTAAASAEDEELAAQRRLARFEEHDASTRANDGKLKRDEWMIVPPKSEDWATKVDPTKLKNRKFNTGKGAKAPQKVDGENTLWTETPEQKRRRLEDEVMGVKRLAAQGGDDKKLDKSAGAEAKETARRIQEYNDKNRSKSLYSDHKARGKYEEDDPSKRAFDREKDIAGGVKINHQQKKEMLQRASDFGSRFSSGSYL